MMACEAMTVARWRRRPAGNAPNPGASWIERIFDALRVGDQQRRLPEIVQHQSGQHHGEPGQADRKAAEMAHVGIHRLATGDGQECGAENGEADVEVLVKQEIEGIERAEGDEDAGRHDDAMDAERGQNGEPYRPSRVRICRR